MERTGPGICAQGKGQTRAREECAGVRARGRSILCSNRRACFEEQQCEM